MAVEIPKVAYTGAIREIQLGDGANAITVGGETSYPFHVFEGEMPNPPRIAMEVYDAPPDDWPEVALEPFEGVTDDPAAWAKKCVDEYDADMICIHGPQRRRRAARGGRGDGAEGCRRRGCAAHRVGIGQR